MSVAYDHGVEPGDSFEIEILYTRGLEDDVAESSDEYRLARDLRSFGSEVFRIQEPDEELLVEAYKSLGEPVSARFDEDLAAEIDDEYLDLRILEEVFDRTQGGRIDEVLPYDGSTTRSMSVGDVVVLDGRAYLVDSVGFQRVDRLDGLVGDVAVLGGAGE